MLLKLTKPTVIALIFTILALGVVGSPETWAADLPRVKFLATGGTIATFGGTRLTAEEILEMVPGLSRFARPEPEQFANVSSTAMTLEQWVLLAKRIGLVDPFRAHYHC